MKNRRFSIVLLAISAILYYLIGYHTIRDDFWQLISLYGLLFIGYFYVTSFGRNALSIKEHIAIGIIFRIILLFSIPALSDDFYRFIWDGKMQLEGYNPFLYKPNDLILPKGILLPVYSIGQDHHLYSLLNSPNYYTIYPPLLQFIFYLSASLGGSILGNVVVMKASLLLAETGTLLILPKLLERLKLDKSLIALYALCPLAIVEFMGNIHFEAFMIFFLIASLLYLAKSNWLLSSTFFGLAVAAKLLPLMFLPFFIRRLGLLKTIAYGLIVLTINTLLFWPFIEGKIFFNFFQSFKLYFVNFEFNGSLYMLLRSIGYLFVNFNIIPYLGKALPSIATLSIFYLAWKEKKPRMATLPKMMLIAYSVYFALATTINPWYIVSFIPLAILSGYRWPLLWAFLIPISYHTYRDGGIDEKWWIVALEYLPVYACALYEFGVLDKWKKKFALSKAHIKLERLKGLYSTEASILEIGCGNGALSKLLREEEHKVEPIDVENKSFFEEIQPKVYDGKHFPQNINTHDVAQMITMLHHTPQPEMVIKEAMRVSNKLIIMEDIYSSTFQKYITWFTDSIVNWEFSNHPHTNKTDHEWRNLFASLNLKVIETKYHPSFLLFFSQVTYLLEKES